MAQTSPISSEHDRKILGICLYNGINVCRNDACGIKMLSLRNKKNLKLPSLKTEKLQRIGKEPVFKGCVDRDHN